MHKQKAKDIVFGRNKKGHFLLPPRSDHKTIKDKQRAVRGYIGAVYRTWFHFIKVLSFY